MTLFPLCRQLAERSGDFSGVSGVQLINPNNGQPIPGNILQNAGLAINPAAQGLLQFIPLPNVTNAAPDAAEFSFCDIDAQRQRRPEYPPEPALGSATKRGRGQRGDSADRATI